MSKAKVMIVEDESIIALDLRRILTRADYLVAGIASSGEAALTAIKAQPPDAVLMDIGLSGELNGIETSYQVLSIVNIPIIFVTANSDLSTVQKAQHANPFGYILKPFDEREIRIVLEMALFKHRMDQEVKESQRWIAATLRSIGEGVIAADTMGAIKFMNPVAEELTGWSEAEAKQASLGEVCRLVQTPTRQAVESPLTRVMRERQRVSYPGLTTVLHRDDSEQTATIFAAPIADEKNNVVGVVVTLRTPQA